MLNDRKRLGKSRQDIFTHLLGEDSETGTTFTQSELQASTELVVIAGTGAFASHPSHTQQKRRMQGLRAIT